MIWIWWMEFLGLVLLAPVAVSCALGAGRRRVAWWVGVVWVLAWVGVGAGLMMDPRLPRVFCETGWMTEWATCQGWSVGWGLMGGLAAAAGVWLGGTMAGRGVKAGRVGLVMLGLGLMMPVTLSELDTLGAVAAQRVHLEGVKLEAAAMEGTRVAPDHANAVVRVMEAQWRAGRVEKLLPGWQTGVDGRFSSGVDDGVPVELERWVRGIYEPVAGLREGDEAGRLPRVWGQVSGGEVECLAGLVLLDAGRGEKGKVMEHLGMLRQVCRVRSKVFPWGFQVAVRRSYEYAWAMDWTGEELGEMAQGYGGSESECVRLAGALDAIWDWGLVSRTGQAAPVLTRIFMLMPWGEWTDAQRMMARRPLPFDTHGIHKLTGGEPYRQGFEEGFEVGRACARFRAANGRWPNSKEELVPVFLKGVVSVGGRGVEVMRKGRALVVGVRGEKVVHGTQDEYGQGYFVIWDKPGEQAR
jgi:hypothetical protein